MSLQEYYEQSFRSENGRHPSELINDVITGSKGLANFVKESKDRFLQNKSWDGLRVLEMGAGRGGLGLQLARLGADVTLVDFSPSALAQAEALFISEGLKVHTQTADVTYPDTSFNQKFDLIVDSHLLHCLTGDADRSSYYQLINDHLTSEGIFVAESMVHRKKLFIPDGFMFDNQNTLWQMFGKWTPVRRILDSLDLEAEIKNSGFNIIYFMYYAQYAFVPHQDFMDIPAEVLPASVRLVFKKN
jgi:SAM-dependent methyltransferase